MANNAVLVELSISFHNLTTLKLVATALMHTVPQVHCGCSACSYRLNYNYSTTNAFKITLVGTRKINDRVLHPQNILFILF